MGRGDEPNVDEGAPGRAAARGIVHVHGLRVGNEKVNTMIQGYLFNITQLLYVENAMELITTYRPNGKTPVQVAGMVTASRGFKDVYLEKLTLRDSGQAGLRLAQVAGHAAVVKVYAIMKSVYTPDALSMEPIVRLPKGDNTPSKTAARMGATAKLWAAFNRCR
jgi:hypothetical protein